VLRKIGAAPFFPVDTMLGVTDGINVASLPNAQNTLSNLLTYRIHNIDMCGNSSPASAEIHNIIISVAPTNGQNTVSWQSSGSFVSTELSRNFNALSSNATSPFADTYISCNLLACYRAVGTYSTISTTTGNPIKTFSFNPCVTSILNTTFPAITTLNSGYVNGTVTVKWTPPVITTVDDYTMNSSGNITNSQTLNGTAASFTSLIEGNCYSLSYEDGCGNESLESAQTCPMRLDLIKTNETIALSWTPYQGYETTGLNSYAVEILNEDGSVRFTSNVGSLLSYTETLDPAYSYFLYRIKAISNGTENMVSYSNTQEVDLTPQLFMPTVFTPNGDGVNDLFVPKGKYLKSVKLTVFNKWGDVIFTTDDALSGWDGTYRGEPVSLDTYSYYVQAEANSGESISKRGVVSVLR
jgi:gliding motility-associated-like protein